MKLPETQRSIRVALPEPLYQELKSYCKSHGELSQLVRSLLIKYLKEANDNGNGNRS